MRSLWQSTSTQQTLFFILTSFTLSPLTHPRLSHTHTPRHKCIQWYSLSRATGHNLTSPSSHIYIHGFLAVHLRGCQGETQGLARDKKPSDCPGHGNCAKCMCSSGRRGSVWGGALRRKRVYRRRSASVNSSLCVHHQHLIRDQAPPCV